MSREHLCPLCRTAFPTGGEVMHHVLHGHRAEVHALPPKKKKKAKRAAPAKREGGRGGAAVTRHH